MVDGVISNNLKRILVNAMVLYGGLIKETMASKLMGVSIVQCTQIFIATQFLCAFLDIWTRLCDKIMQFKVDNILNSHCCEIDSHLNNAMVGWSTFLICRNLPQKL